MGACLGSQTQGRGFAWDKQGEQCASFQVLASSGCWQHAGTSTAADDADATLCKYPHTLCSPLCHCLDFPWQGWERICCRASAGGGRQGGDSGVP